MAAKQPKKSATRKKAAIRPKKAKSRRSKPFNFSSIALGHGRRALWLGLEIAALAAAALVVVIAALGRAAERFGGVDLWSNLLPFAAAVFALAAGFFLAIKLWLKIRAPLSARADFLSAALALMVACGAAWFAAGVGFQGDLASLRVLVGGTQEAERNTLAHQVYAAYRRADLEQMQVLAERAKPYQAIIEDAAAQFGVDAEVMMGIGAAESSFLPRDSKDGGRGLFQITAPPKPVLEQVGKLMDGKPLDWRDAKHNAILAAATWRYYQKEMNEDLFLGLLAYNIGPKNGGLLSIMRQYGARDFVTIQPYLQNLPRDYPIRVLSAALAFRLSKREGRLPHYEEGDNAKRIQAIGIPGLQAAPSMLTGFGLAGRP